MWKLRLFDHTCPACEVYKDLVQAKNVEISRLASLLADEKKERQDLETRILQFARVIPPAVIIPHQGDQPVINRRLDWPAEKAKLEKEAASRTPEGESKRLYWSKKAEEVNEKIEKEAI